MTRFIAREFKKLRTRLERIEKNTATKADIERVITSIEALSARAKEALTRI
jgi:hypothetical protein